MFLASPPASRCASLRKPAVWSCQPKSLRSRCQKTILRVSTPNHGDGALHAVSDRELFRRLLRLDSLIQWPHSHFSPFGANLSKPSRVAIERSRISRAQQLTASSSGLDHQKPGHKERKSHMGGSMLWASPLTKTGQAESAQIPVPPATSVRGMN